MNGNQALPVLNAGLWLCNGLVWSLYAGSWLMTIASAFCVALSVYMASKASA